jgi:hypothetical protein
MKILGNIVGTLLALALIATLGFGGYLSAKRYVTLFARLDFTVALVTATAVVVVFLATMIIAGSIRQAGATAREAQFRVGKAETYNLFIGVWGEILRPGQPTEARAEFSSQMRELNRLLTLHGSAPVLKAHRAMPSLNLPEARAQFGDALLAIRKDLGLESHGLTGTDLQQLLLVEADEATRISPGPARHDTQPRISLSSHF